MTLFSRQNFDRKSKRKTFYAFPICYEDAKFFVFKLKDNKNNSSEILNNVFDYKLIRWKNNYKWSLILMREKAGFESIYSDQTLHGLIESGVYYLFEHLLLSEVPRNECLNFSSVIL